MTRVMHVSIEFWFWCSLNLESEKRRENGYGIENDDGGEENSVKMEKGGIIVIVLLPQIWLHIVPPFD